MSAVPGIDGCRGRVLGVVRRGAWALPASLVALLASACWGGGDVSIAESQRTPDVRCATDCVPFHLFLTNQSFIDENVELIAEVDGEQVVHGRFPVGSQHTWIQFNLELQQGEHVLHVRAPEPAIEFEHTFDLGPELWAVVFYWHSEDQGPEFHFDRENHPIGAF